MERAFYIIETKQGKFKPFCAQIVPDADDSSLYVIANLPACDTLVEAQLELQENVDPTHHVDKFYLNSVKASDNGLTWLSELKLANPNVI